jgi:hypothetical protein
MHAPLGFLGAWGEQVVETFGGKMMSRAIRLSGSTKAVIAMNFGAKKASPSNLLRMTVFLTSCRGPSGHPSRLPLINTSLFAIPVGFAAYTGI